jgi:hypothetical protein
MSSNVPSPTTTQMVEVDRRIGIEVGPLLADDTIIRIN